MCVCMYVSCSVVSDSLHPPKLLYARLLHPWDSLGKITRVDYHCLSPEDLPDLGIEPWSLALQADSLPFGLQERSMICTNTLKLPLSIKLGIEIVTVKCNALEKKRLQVSFIV